MYKICKKHTNQEVSLSFVRGSLLTIVILPPGAPATGRRDGIARYWDRQLAIGLSDVQILSREALAAGPDRIYETALVTWHGAGGAAPRGGRRGRRGARGIRSRRYEIFNIQLDCRNVPVLCRKMSKPPSSCYFSWRHCS